MQILRQVAFVLVGLSVVACQAASLPMSPAETQVASAVPSATAAATVAAPGVSAEATPQPVPIPGMLEGKVKIGPLSPVERPGQDQPAPAPEVFTSRGIAVYQVDGKTLVTHASFKEDGTYQVKLPAGVYIIDLYPKVKMERAEDLPKQVQIEPGKVTRLDLEIDTGLR